MLFKKLFEKLRIVGIDQFKLEKPEIPSCVGLSYGLTSAIAILLLNYANYINSKITLAYVLMTIITIIIGLIDDLLDPPGLFKPLAMISAGVPIILLKCYKPYLKTVLYGGFNIPIIYPLLILISFPIASNTVNMLDVINGSALIGVLLTLISGLISSIILKSKIGFLISLVLISSTIGLLIYNVYPARIFLGNVGTLLLGSSIAFLAITAGIELPLVVAMFPFIHNSFYFLAKVKGFVEHKKLNVNITYLDSKGRINDASDPNAPLTILRFLVAGEPKEESTALLQIATLFIISMTLSIITAYLISIRV